MTLEQFLERLEKTPRDWFLAEGRLLRRRSKKCERCPITAMVKRFAYSSEYPDIAIEIGLPSELAESIAAAADRTPDFFDGTLRSQLLKACNLA